LSSGEYLPGSLQGKISSDSCLKKEQMVVSAIVSTPHNASPEVCCVMWSAEVMTIDILFQSTCD
ncbi:hypothetical protein, partial [Escherichia coli]|uniref:hypothetical protein n=1 Tax=Escherichia coli TaxID=562 RepID=UPI0021BA4B8B